MRYLLITAFLALGFALPAHAQQDEIIVTGTRIADDPAIFIEKRGDFLLLDVRVMNDSRESDARKKELETTVETIIQAAKANPQVILSLVDDNDFVRPLTKMSFMDSIRPGRQPDTSFANLKVKTEIPASVDDSYELVKRLEKFVDGLEGKGRTVITNYDNVAVSILNPYQHRNEVRSKILAEMKSTVDALGTDYVIIPKGLDGPVRWTRSGDLNLAFTMRYSYKIYPKIVAVEISERGEWE